MVQSFTSLDQIEPENMSAKVPSSLEVEEISIFDLLPTTEDEVAHKAEMTVIVERILCEEMEVFKNLEVMWHIPHKYSKESSKKSTIVSYSFLIQTRDI